MLKWIIACFIGCVNLKSWLQPRPFVSKLYHRCSVQEDLCEIRKEGLWKAVCNAVRLTNAGVDKGDEVSVFMPGKGVTYEESDSKGFNVMGQMDNFEGDFYL